MNEKVPVFPDYENSILGIPNSILKYFELEATQKTNPILDDVLKNNYKNIVYLILDALGQSTLNNALEPSDFLRENTVQTISSVFPSSTMAAWTGLVSGLSPLEHGSLSSDRYFKKENVLVDLFTNKNIKTGEVIADLNFWDTYFPYETLDEKIKNNKKFPNINTYRLYPSTIDKINGFIDIESMLDKIEEISNNSNEKNFILAYRLDIDILSHKFGPKSEEVVSFVKHVNNYIENISKNMQDTLIIITADHGQLEIDEGIVLDSYPDVLDCLSEDPFFGERCPSFNVKEEKKLEFLELFEKYFSEDFKIFSKDEFIKLNLLGGGKPHELAYEIIGDYIALGIGKKTLRFCNYNHESINKIKKGKHGGSTKEELEVPLILKKIQQKHYNYSRG